MRGVGDADASSSRALRVLHVISSLDPRAGGTTTLLETLARFQKRGGIDVHVASNFAAGFDESAVQRLRAAGVGVDLIGPNRRLLAWHRDIAPTLRRLIPGVDVVHIHGAWEEIQHRAARVARAAGRPYVFTPHGMLDPWSLSQSAVKKRVYLTLRLRRDLNEAAAVHYADEVERDLVNPLKLRSPTFVLRHLLDLEEFKNLPEPGMFRRAHGIDPNKKMLLFLSRLHAKKGLDLLLPAVARLKRQDLTLVLAGPGSEDYLAALRQQVRELGLEASVVFVGMVAGAQRVSAFADADLFVLPSYQENFGLVVIESLAAGTPVIVSDQVNIHRQITRGLEAADCAGSDRAVSTGPVGGVTRTNVDELTAILARWLDDAELRNAAAARARPFVSRRYDADHIAGDWLRFYRDVAAGNALKSQSS